MPRQTDQERGRMFRKAMKGLRVKPRRLDLPTVGMCLGLPRPRDWRNWYRESDDDYLRNNRELAVALLEALEARLRR